MSELDNLRAERDALREESVVLREEIRRLQQDVMSVHGVMLRAASRAREGAANASYVLDCQAQRLLQAGERARAFLSDGAP